jgi:hypothetical protein
MDNFFRCESDALLGIEIISTILFSVSHMPWQRHVYIAIYRNERRTFTHSEQEMI